MKYPRFVSVMKYPRFALTVAALLMSVSSAFAAEPSASIPSQPTGRWQGTATEFPGIYSGPVSEKITLDLRPDGTYTETSKQGGEEETTHGMWRADGRRVILRSSDRSHERLSLRRRGDALYTVETDALPTGRATTLAIELHPAP
jgi:hypothetical protein